MDTTRNQTEKKPLILKEIKASRLCGSNRFIYLFGVAATISICIFLFSLSPNEQQPHDHEMIQKEGSIVRQLYTDNPNDYLCDPHFLFSTVNANPELYPFTCLDDDGILACDEGFQLKCLVSATYGDTAGGCTADYNEVVETPYGCGFKLEDGLVTCKEGSFTCSGSHSAEVNSCFNLETDEVVYTSSPCADCVPMCHCGGTSPQFYNVADAYGDVTSSACVDQLNEGSSTAPGLYFPQSAWDEYCEGQKKCIVKKHSLYEPADGVDCGDTEYYRSVKVNGEHIAEFSDTQFVGVDDIDSVLDLYHGECLEMMFKMLAVCEPSE